jgi:hypothetical protein
MFLGNTKLGYPAFDQTNDTFKLAQAMIAMRKNHDALRLGTVTPEWSTSVAGARRDAGIFGFERVAPTETALVVLNSSQQTSETCAPTTEGGACMHTSFAPGTVLNDVMPGSDGKTFTVAADGTIDVDVAARSGRVLVK